MIIYERLYIAEIAGLQRSLQCQIDWSTSLVTTLKHLSLVGAIQHSYITLKKDGEASTLAFTNPSVASKWGPYTDTRLVWIGLNSGTDHSFVPRFHGTNRLTQV